jgi:hypothetical protein
MRVEVLALLALSSQDESVDFGDLRSRIGTEKELRTVSIASEPEKGSTT